jgi:tRNA threonylcarbamoyladenosine biosynthesis protein TsaE
VIPVLLADAEATRHAGAALASLVTGGDTIALVGDLGAGKTTLVAGLVEALGGGTAASPTFSLVNEYPAGRLVVWHVDLYRLERAAELVELGLEDVIGDRRGICVIEWADKFDVLPADHLHLELLHEEATRSLVAIGTGPRGKELASKLVSELLRSPE